MTAIKKLYYSVWYQTTYYYYERRHFKLFTNCHVSWDTLYLNKLGFTCKNNSPIKIRHLAQFRIFSQTEEYSHSSTQILNTRQIGQWFISFHQAYKETEIDLLLNFIHRGKNPIYLVLLIFRG